jgi:hypothetical protein
MFFFYNFFRPVDLVHIFKGNLANNLTWELDFSEISKRRFDRSYLEQTSYDPEGRNGDFFNPVRVGNGGLILFEEYGPGIFERLLVCLRLNPGERPVKRLMYNVTFEVS